MPILLVLLIAAIVELTVLVMVGQAIGVLATIALLVVASLLGAVLLRREGTRTLTAFFEALRTRRPPHRELVDGMLIAAAGIFIVLPGFISDVLGLLLLLPPVRALVRRRILRSVSLGNPMSLHVPVRFKPADVVEGEVVDEPPASRPTTGELR